MLETHNSNDGPIMICQMDDSHLTNTIRLFCRRITQVRAAAQAPPDGDDYSRALYSIRKMDAETAGEINRLALTKLYPYLAEALLRGLDVREHLVEAVGRDKGLNDQTALLTHKIENIDF